MSDTDTLSITPLPAATPGFIDRHMGRIVIVCVVGTCICLAGLSYLQVQFRSQASEGAKARERQIRTKPVACKEHTKAWRDGVITYHDLVDVWGCPRPAPQFP